MVVLQRGQPQASVPRYVVVELGTRPELARTPRRQVEGKFAKARQKNRLLLGVIHR